MPRHKKFSALRDEAAARMIFKIQLENRPLPSLRRDYEMQLLNAFHVGANWAQGHCERACREMKQRAEAAEQANAALRERVEKMTPKVIVGGPNVEVPPGDWVITNGATAYLVSRSDARPRLVTSYWKAIEVLAAAKEGT